MIQRITRWSGGIAAAIVLAAAGLAGREATLLVAAVVPLAYVTYGSLSSVPNAKRVVTVSRTLDATTVPPGQPVTVSLTVTNEGARLLPDVRVVDGVPGPLRVLDGSPRNAGVLRPGESLTVSYRLLAKRGTHEFDEPTVRLRSLAASAVSTSRATTAGDRRLDCRLDADAPPLAETASGYAGQLATDQPGDGLEFHSTREYVPGDPTVRIDWHHYAKRGQLATINFRARRSATVVLVLDAREPAGVVAGPGHPSGTELAAYAATRAMAELLRAGHDVGIAILGADDQEWWLPPAAGRDHRARAAATIRAGVDQPPTDEEPAVRARRIVDRAPPGTQAVLFSPMLDDGPIAALDVWRAAGLPRVVIAPDVLADNTVSGQFAGIRRHERLVRAMRTGATTVDWRRGTPLPLALQYGLSTDGGRPSP